MAERNDNQGGGRMLFTDFDVSDKGRPVPVLSQSDMQSFMRSNLPSIVDIASNLELDFEDDADAPEPFPARDGDAGTRREPPPPRDDIPESDEDFLDVDTTVRDASAPPVTWEGFANTFRAAPSAAAAPPVAEDLPVSAGPADAGPAEDDIDDVLSFLAAFPMEPHGSPSAVPDPTEYAGARLGAPPPPATPYGGLERVDDWYTPPENAAAPPPSSREWYEPPVGGEVGYAKQPTRRIERSVDADESATDTRSIDMFSDIDLDAAWDAKLRRRPAAETGRRGDTASPSLFDDVDLDSIWEEKRRDALARADKSARTPDGPQHGDTTLILSAEELYPASAPEAAEAGPPEPDSERDDDEAEGVDLLKEVDADLSGRPPPAVSATADSGGAVRPSRPEPAGRAASGEAARGFNLDDIIFEEDADVSVGDASVTAPRIDDGDLVDLRSLAGAAEAAAEEPPSPAAAGAAGKVGVPPDAAAATESVREGSGLPSESEDADAPAAEAADVPAAEAGEAEEGVEEREPGLTTDDLLNDLDFDDGAGIDHNVSAPVIDDSAIDHVAEPRRGTEEMEAIAAHTSGGGEASVALDPADVFANMDDMDFSDDGLDDEMQAMLDEDDGSDAVVPPAAAATGEHPAVAQAPAGRVSRAVGALFRVIPARYLERLEQLIAWRENWWFYCDLLAAVIASGSLAVIISYYVWYRK